MASLTGKGISKPLGTPAAFPPARALPGILRIRSAPRHICRHSDYVAAGVDEGVLKLNPRTELKAAEITHVYGYPRDLPEKYWMGKVIGCGSFGVVQECLEAATGHRYAVKRISKIPKKGAPTPRYLLKLRAEVEIMKQLGYSLNAVNLKDVFEDNENIHLVMELCEGGELLERIESGSGNYSEKYIASLVRSMLRFISQSHAKGFIYRDVKPDNFIFLTKDPSSPLKATDFGLAIQHWPTEPKLTSRSGTPAYMAPELIMQSYDEKCDIWSIGMLTYQLLTGRFPYWEDVRDQSLPDVWKAILNNDISFNAPWLRNLSSSAVDFLRVMLMRDPADRPSASDALEHPWIREEGTAEEMPLQGSVVQRLQRFSTYGHLKQMVLKMIATEIHGSIDGNAEESIDTAAIIGSVKGLFETIDSNKSGGISKEELKDGLAQQGYTLSDSELEVLMRKVDSDRDGSIDLPELMTTLIDWNVLQREKSWQVLVDRAFTQLDHDGNGSISLDELMVQLSRSDGASAGTLTEIMAEAKQMLREADTDGNGKVSREEFYALLKDNHAQDALSLYDDRLSANVGGWNGAGVVQPTKK